MAVAGDDFTGANGALVRLRAGWTYQGPVAQQDRGTIQTNRFRCGGGGGASLHYGYVQDAGETAHYVEARFLRITGVGCCVYARWTNETNFIAIRNSGSNVEIIKRVAGTITSVASVAAGLVAGDVVRLSVSGTTAKLYRNGSQIGAGGGYTIADTALQTGTRVGLGGEGAVGSFEFFDDFAGGALTAVLVAADGRSGQAAESCALTAYAVAELTPDAAAHGVTDGAAALLLRLGLAPDGGVMGVRDTPPWVPRLGPPTELGEIMVVAADSGFAVAGEAVSLRVAAD